MIAQQGLQAWHEYMSSNGDAQHLRAQLADNAIFHSPVVHSPQHGRDKVFAYLHAAAQVFPHETFRYVREILDGDTAMLEFTCEMDGIHINGVDIIHWNADGLIDDFKVMIRPLQAVNKIWDEMGKMLKQHAQ